MNDLTRRADRAATQFEPLPDALLLWLATHSGDPPEDLLAMAAPVMERNHSAKRAQSPTTAPPRPMRKVPRMQPRRGESKLGAVT